MKKIVSLVMVVAMACGILSACGGNSESTTTTTTVQESSTGEAGESTEPTSQGENSAINFDEEPYTLVVCYPVLSEAQPDLPLIEEAINEITLKEINAKVKFEAVSLFSMANIYALKASGQEKVDLMMLMPGSSYLAPFAGNNMIQPIDDYVYEWGNDMKEVLGDTLEAGRFNGRLYAIPQNKDVLANGYGVGLPVELCEKYDIDIDSIKTIADLEEAFAIIKANEPDMVVVAPEQTGSNLATILMGKLDGLGTGPAKLEVADDGSLKAVSTVKSESYMEAAKIARRWYEAGYVSKDVTTSQESGSQMQWSGKVFATLAPSLATAGGNITNGVQIRQIFLEDIPNPVMRITGDAQMSVWTVPTSCERPDKAVQFLNLAFKNEEIGNIFRYGIEGTHYEVNDDQSVKLINTAGWQNNWYLLGDYGKINVRADALASSGFAVEEYLEKEKEWNENIVEVSPAFGFTFDISPVATEKSNLDAVNEEFGASIGNGVVDPETEIPKYIERLEEAGLQKFLDELQRQLDAWVELQE